MQLFKRNFYRDGALVVSKQHIMNQKQRGVGRARQGSLVTSYYKEHLLMKYRLREAGQAGKHIGTAMQGSLPGKATLWFEGKGAQNRVDLVSGEFSIGLVLGKLE